MKRLTSFIKMMHLFFLLLFCQVSSPVKHSFKGFLTASSVVQSFPEVVAVALVNDVLVSYCDSKIKTTIPKQDWMENLRDGDPNYWRLYAHDCTVQQQLFKEEFLILKQRLNKTGSVQILQKMLGCEWDDETGEVLGYLQYGYDGEDFLTFDFTTETWIAPKPQAVITKHFWDRQRAKNEFWRDFLTHNCPDWLRKHLNYGRSSLLRTVLPSVSLLQRSPSSPVSCHATGFHPDRAMMFWRKDGEELHEDVDIGEILPNHDGSFQMTADLKLSSVAPEDWRRYDCVFQLSRVMDNIVTKLDKDVIRTNWGKRLQHQVHPVVEAKWEYSIMGPVSESPADPGIGVFVGLLLLLALCITGLFIWRRNQNGFRPANSSDYSSSETSSVRDAAEHTIQ